MKTRITFNGRLREEIILAARRVAAGHLKRPLAETMRETEYLAAMLRNPTGTGTRYAFPDGEAWGDWHEVIHAWANEIDAEVPIES